MLCLVALGSSEFFAFFGAHGLKCLPGFLICLFSTFFHWALTNVSQIYSWQRAFNAIFFGLHTCRHLKHFLSYSWIIFVVCSDGLMNLRSEAPRAAVWWALGKNRGGIGSFFCSGRWHSSAIASRERCGNLRLRLSSDCLFERNVLVGENGLLETSLLLCPEFLVFSLSTLISCFPWTLEEVLPGLLSVIPLTEVTTTSQCSVCPL